MDEYDVIIIGAGVIGCAAARELSRRNARILVLERALDVAEGATKANSAIVHAGFDAKPGSNKARFNIAGNALFEPWCEELGVHFQRNTSLVVAFDAADEAHLRELQIRGEENGVATKILTGDDARALEPNLSADITAALLAPTGGITCPYKLTIRLAEHAAENGAKFVFGAEVATLAKPPASPDSKDGGALWTATTADGRAYRARAILNAAGAHSDRINNAAGAPPLNIHPRRGEYLMLDRAHGAPPFNATIFQAPTAMGKGVLVSPTVDGTVIVGPTAEEIPDPDDTDTTPEGAAKILDSATRVWAGGKLPRRAVIASFSGIRAHCDRNDFVIGETPGAPLFFNAAGIESPGLTSAPAIAIELAAQISQRLALPQKPGADWLPPPTSHRPLREMDAAQRAAAAAADPAYGTIVCRCETVSEAEVRAALRGKVPATTLDGVKRRVRAGMGRCQGGFCAPRIIQIMSEELGIPETEILKSTPGSKLLTSPLFDDETTLAAATPAPPTPASDDPSDDSSATRSTSPDILIIGAGPAGLAAAIAAKNAGAKDVLILERAETPGGILRQCIHPGFGLELFKEELTGPEYAQRHIDQALAAGVRIQCSTMVLQVLPDKTVAASSPRHGLQRFTPKSLILAMGCRERPRGALMIPGARPAGIYTAGAAQRLVNLDGFMPGKRVVILGSGDIGLIMARRMTFEGAKVLACVELMPYSAGLARNIAQCLDDFGIPLHLESTVTQIHGRARLKGVTIAKVKNGAPIPGTEQYIECDTLLLSVGLLPENELSRGAGVSISDITGGPIVGDSFETNIPGIFACGNVLHVHDLADYASLEAEEAGKAAAAAAAAALGNREWGMGNGNAEMGNGEWGMGNGNDTKIGNREWGIGNGDDAVGNAAAKTADASANETLEVLDGAGVRGIVPQKVALPAFAASGKIAFSFRPAGLYRNSVLTAELDGVEIFRKKSLIFTPGEMQRILIPTSKLTAGRELRFSIK